MGEEAPVKVSTRKGSAGSLGARQWRVSRMGWIRPVIPSKKWGDSGKKQA
jgi:hypothetical protein